MPASARRREAMAIAAFGLLYAVASTFVTHSYYQLILTVVPVWAVMGLSWNLLSGYSGFVSFGHAAFFGLGAYFVALTQIKWGLTPWIGMLAGAAVAVAAAILIGLPTFRLAGIYFGLATLAYPLIFRIVMEYLGYQEVAIPMERGRPILMMQFEEPRSYDLLALGLLAATLVLSYAIESSRIGYSLRALKENEAAAEAMDLAG